jgi:hypothetical protein
MGETFCVASKESSAHACMLSEFDSDNLAPPHVCLSFIVGSGLSETDHACAAPPDPLPACPFPASLPFSPADNLACATGVCTVVQRKIEQEAALGVPLAKLLLGKINRKTVKQTVMTYVYGVTMPGSRLCHIFASEYLVMH